MALAHKLLEITEEQLRTVNDEFVSRALQRKLQQIEEEEKLKLEKDRVIELEVFENKKAELRKAFAELDTQQKRQEYLAKLNAEPIYVTAAGKQGILIAATSIPEIVKKYDEFVAKEYKTHPEKEKFKAEKCSFNNFDEFKRSDLYKGLSAIDRQRFSTQSFPREVTVLTFAKPEDALKFLQDIESQKLVKKGTTQRFRQLIEQQKAVPTLDHDDEPRETVRPRF